MSASDYFMIIGAIYISHEVPPILRTITGVVCISIGLAIQFLGTK